MKKDDITFYELQRPKRWFFLLFFIPVVVSTIVIMQTNPDNLLNYISKSGESILISIFLTILTLLLIINMLLINLKTVVDRDGIHIRMWLCPFYTNAKSFFWDDVSEITIKKFNPILTYSVWGIFLGADNRSRSFCKTIFPPKIGINFGYNSISYTISGNTGIQFVLHGKKNILIGTNKPEELSETLRELGKYDYNIS